ncbi:TonB-dependent receptor [Fodinibius halophilus]|uniref:TonB-dependent receptor n=1 Tax=Fodinibius halophilus TaxID=1736908 RepID=A0A6M1T4Q0_9BACT|nr:TonB-dependent receptor [Fodinibius halophilus]NGP87653.1 TonB-dependent receptor [Fodinibius halophilus]
MNIIKYTTTAILLLCAISTSLAQQTATINGQVFNEENNKPLPGVNVIIKNTNNGASTNSEGKFQLLEISPGSHTVIFSFIGFKKVTKGVQLSAGEMMELEIQLTPQAMLLNGIQVTALRPDQIAEAKMKEADVKEANPRDSGELLRNIAGVDAVRRGPVGLDPVIRGLRETEVGTYLDGTRIFPGGPARMDSPLSHLDPTAIKKIEVVKGPYALTWGAGNMSAVHVETQPLNTVTQVFGGTVSSGYDSNLGAIEEAVSVRGSTGKFGYWVHGAWREGDDFESGNGTRIPGNFLSRELRAKLGYAITPNSYVNISVGYQNQENLDYPGRLLNADFFDTYNYSANWEWTPENGILSSLKAQAYINNVDHGMDNDGKPTAQADANRMPPFPLDVTVDAQAHVTGGNIMAELNPASSWKLEIGTDIYSANRDAVRTIDRRNEGMKPAMFPLVDQMWPDATITDLGLFTKVKHSFTDRLNATSTVRLDLVYTDAGPTSDFFANNVATDLKQSETNLSGSFTLNYIANKQWTIGAGLGSVVRTADATERYSDRIPASKAQTSAEFVGNPSLDPERSTQADLWLDAAYNSWNLSVNLFGRQIDDYITFEATNLPKRLPLSPDTVFQYINGKARFWGVDLSASYRITNELSINSGAHYLWGTDVSLDEPALGISPFGIDGGLRYESAQRPWFVESSFHWTSEQDRVAITRGETPTNGYITTDIKTGLTVWNRLSLQGGIKNLTNAQYVNHLNAKNPFTKQPIPEPGRVFHLDITYKF